MNCIYIYCKNNLCHFCWQSLHKNHSLSLNLKLPISNPKNPFQMFGQGIQVTPQIIQTINASMFASKGLRLLSLLLKTMFTREKMNLIWREILFASIYCSWYWKMLPNSQGKRTSKLQWLQTMKYWPSFKLCLKIQ